MTIAASDPLSGALPGAEVGLPDLHALTALANRLFRAPPGGAGIPDATLPGSPFAAAPPAPPALGGVGAPPPSVQAAALVPEIPVRGATSFTSLSAPTPSSAQPGLPSPVQASVPTASPALGGFGVSQPTVLSGGEVSGGGLPGGLPSLPDLGDVAGLLALNDPAAPRPSAPALGGVGAPVPPVPSVVPLSGGGLPAGVPSLPNLPDISALLAPKLPAGPGVPADVPALPGATSPAPSSFYFAPTEAAGAPRPVSSSLDVPAIRRDFPILAQRVHGKPLIWFDNAATTQKPRQVIDRLSEFYRTENSNIHRAAHTLAARATDAYESARETVRRFLNADSESEIVFVRGTTEAINLVAQSWGRQNIRAGDEIIVSWLEHHANIVPWQLLCQETGAVLKVIPVDDHGDLDLAAYQKLLGPRTRLVSVTQVSNALGTVTPAAEIVALAHRYGAKALVDGAQSVSHMPVDVQALDADFFVFSGHKIFAPTGIGALYGKAEVLADMPPWQGGGNMIEDVTFEQTRFHPAPFKFEAGTGNIADAAGLGAALDYVMKLGMAAIGAYEHQLIAYALHRLAPIPGVQIIGAPKHRAGVLSLVIEGVPTDSVGKALDKDGIAVRSGHHCAQPILRRFGYEATVRPSFAFYNTPEEIDVLADSLRRIASGASVP